MKDFEYKDELPTIGNIFIRIQCIGWKNCTHEHCATDWFVNYRMSISCYFIIMFLGIMVIFMCYKKSDWVHEMILPACSWDVTWEIMVIRGECIYSRLVHCWDHDVAMLIILFCKIGFRWMDAYSYRSSSLVNSNFQWNGCSQHTFSIEWDMQALMVITVTSS